MWMFLEPQITGSDSSGSTWGSPHVHGVAWLHNAPDIEKLLSSDDSAELLDTAEHRSLPTKK